MITLPGDITIQVPDSNQVSDGYHTFGELYDHRCHLFCLLSQQQNLYSWKSHKHSDGEIWDGWFICGINLCSGVITYHLPVKLWDLFCGEELEFAPQWDGHTSSDVIKRIKEHIENND